MKRVWILILALFCVITMYIPCADAKHRVPKRKTSEILQGLLVQGIIGEKGSIEATLMVDGNIATVKVGDTIERQSFMLKVISIDPKKFTVRVQDDQGHSALVTTTLATPEPTPLPTVIVKIVNPTNPLVVTEMNISKQKNRSYGYIVGTLKNNSDQKYSYVSIKFNLYDANGRLVGNAHDGVQNLEPRGSWQFKATSYHINNATKVTVQEITGR